MDAKPLKLVMLLNKFGSFFQSVVRFVCLQKKDGNRHVTVFNKQIALVFEFIHGLRENDLVSV